MSEREHDQRRDDVAAYALGALEPSETAAFEGHLLHCDRCDAELAHLLPAVERLPFTVPRIDPPPQLRKRVMAAIAAEEASTAPVRRRSGWPRWLAPAVALGLALLIAVGAGLVARDRGGRDTATVPARALTAAATQAALVRGDDGWQLHVDRLPGLQAGRVYEIWVQSGRRVMPSTLFVLSRDGRARVPIPGTMRAGDVVMVTAEPAGGSAAPTSAPLLLARV